MKILYKYIFICFMLIAFQTSFSQNKIIDSLRLLLKSDKPDTNKLIHLNKLSWEYIDISSYDSALYFANSALLLSDLIYSKQSNVKSQEVVLKCKANSLNEMGVIHRIRGNYPEALKNNLAGLQIFEKINYKKGIAYSYNNIGNIYYNLENYPEALKNYYASLNIEKEIGSKNDIARALSNIATIYKIQGNYAQALKENYNCLEIFKKENDSVGLSISYNNIGTTYSNQADQEKNPVLRNKQLEESLKNNFLALKIREKIKDMDGIAVSYYNIGLVLNRQKNIKASKEYIDKARSIALLIRQKEYLVPIYSELSNLDSALGDFKGAYENHKFYIIYRDSLDNEETRKKTIQTQMTYDFEKKEAVASAEHKKELEKQELVATEKSRKQKIVIIFVVCGLLLVILFAGFIFRSLRITRKQKDIIEQQKSIVELQKLEVEQQKLIVEEHQKEIIDSITYARRIQQSLLPTEKYISKTINRLKKV